MAPDQALSRLPPIITIIMDTIIHLVPALYLRDLCLLVPALDLYLRDLCLRVLFLVPAIIRARHWHLE